MSATLDKLKSDLRKLANPEKKSLLQRYFKTGKGEYAEGDVFLGVMVPQSRSVARKYKNLPIEEVEKLLSSKIHEERLAAILILVDNFQKGNALRRKQIFELYLKNTRFINNWDLVDLSAHKIIGAFLFENRKQMGILKKFAQSENLWERRMAAISTFYFIGQREFKPSLEIAELLIFDKHDLIHKAVGWMLREIGKIDNRTEIEFLKKNHTMMPRMMLRYAVEKFNNEMKDEILG